MQMCISHSSGRSRIFGKGVQVLVDYCNSKRCYIVPGKGGQARVAEALALVMQNGTIRLCKGCEAVDYPCKARKICGTYDRQQSQYISS